MIWWFLFIVVFLLAIRLAWRAYKDAAHQLGMEAAHMGWLASGTVTDSNGYRNTLLVRGGNQVVILYKEKCVQCLRPPLNGTFKDFQSLEKRLAELDIDDDEDEYEDESKVENIDIHPSLDAAAARVVDYLEMNNWGGDTIKLGIASELFVYAATFTAMKESSNQLNTIGWNTFKHAIENRMLAIQDDGSKRSGVEQGLDGSYAFVQYASSYSKRFDAIDFVGARIPNEVSRKAVVRQVLTALDADSTEFPDFDEFFKKITEQVSRTIYPKLCKLFG